MAKSVYFVKWEDSDTIYFIPHRSDVRDGCFYELHIYREFTYETKFKVKYPHVCHKWFLWITPRQYEDLCSGKNYSHFLELVNETISNVKPHFVYSY